MAIFGVGHNPSVHLFYAEGWLHESFNRLTLYPGAPASYIESHWPYGNPSLAAHCAHCNFCESQDLRRLVISQVWVPSWEVKKRSELDSILPE